MTDLQPDLSDKVRWSGDAGPLTVAGYLSDFLSHQPDAIIAVPGGSTPGPILAALAQQPVDWTRPTFWLTDDRLVAADHPASNFGLLQRHFAGTGAAVVPLSEDVHPPRFDLVWLGMGEDGHIASLFPNTDPQADEPRRVVRLTPDPLPPEAPFDRLSLTLPALTDSAAIMLVVRGAAKKAVLDAAIAGNSELPIARLLSAARGPVSIFWSET